MNWEKRHQQKMFPLRPVCGKRTKQGLLDKWYWTQLKVAIRAVMANRERRAGAGVFA